MIFLYIFSFIFVFSAATKNVCQTDECKKLGDTMVSLMNDSISPCDDFYESVCAKTKLSYGSTLFEEMYNNIDQLEEIMKTFQPETSNQKVALVALQKCVNDTQGDPNTFMKEFWEDENNDLTTLIIELSKMNPESNGLFQFLMNVEEKDGIKRIKYFLDPVIVKVANSFVPWKLIAESVKFMNVTEFVYQLLPEGSRSYDAFDDSLVLAQDFNKIDEKITQLGDKKVREILRNQWLKELNKRYIEKHTLTACLQEHVRHAFPGTSATIFLNKTIFKPENVERAKTMFKSIQSEMSAIILENEWIDEEMKTKMIEKIDAVSVFMGIPSIHENQTALNTMYDRILNNSDINKLSYLEILRNLAKMNMEETFLRVSRGETVTFLDSPMIANANYFSFSHGITVGYFFLAYPFLDYNLPEWSILASYSFVVAHEVSHMFGPKDVLIGRDAHQNTIQLSENFQREYEKRKQCLIKQYSTFQYPGFDDYLNGENTVSENFADILASKVVHRLFRKHITTENNQESLPGLEKFTIEQQFFQRAAHVWCSNDADKETIDEYKNRVHSPNMFRVRGMTLNSPVFGEIFGCPVGSPMNPKDKCDTF